jgi:hypothetical protein
LVFFINSFFSIPLEISFFIYILTCMP